MRISRREPETKISGFPFLALRGDFRPVSCPDEYSIIRRIRGSRTVLFCLKLQCILTGLFVRF
jgi:hypothetical protein